MANDAHMSAFREKHMYVRECVYILYIRLLYLMNSIIIYHYIRK